MCVVSMVSDHYKDKWSDQSWIQPTVPYPNTNGDIGTGIASWPINQQITRAEFDAFRKEFQEFKKLVERAKQYDIDNNEPECELDEKTKIIKAIAEQFGIEINIK